MWKNKINKKLAIEIELINENELDSFKNLRKTYIN